MIYDFVEQNYPTIAKKFENGVKYTKVIPEISNPNYAIGNSWKDTFRVNNREELEIILKRDYDSWEWI